MTERIYDRQELLAKLDALAAQEGSLNRACRKVGINASIVSSLRGNNYKGNTDVQWAKLAEYFAVKGEAAKLPSAKELRGYVPTSISEAVYSVIRNCQLGGGLAVACGDAGIGKTMAARKFERDWPDSTIYITLNPCLTSQKALLKLLSNRLGVYGKSVDELWYGVLAKLRDGMVIVVDEAQHLPVRTLEILRAWSDDFAERGQTLGVCFIGNTETAAAVGGRGRAAMAQISSRTRQRKLYTTSHVKLVDMSRLFPDLSPDGAELEFLLAVARSASAIRGAAHLYNNALDNGNTSYDGIVAMAKSMEIQIHI